MAETMQSLDQLGTLKPAAPEAPKYVQKLDKQGRAYATGKRKDAVARVWVKPGAGKIVVNTRELDIYFARPVLRMLIQQPLVATNRNGQYDIICTVSGGGSRALVIACMRSSSAQMSGWMSGWSKVLSCPPEAPPGWLVSGRAAWSGVASGGVSAR